MIKYLGSKRRLVPMLAELAQATGATTALDLFTGTTRVAQAFKQVGIFTTAVDSARYAHAFAQCYVATDANDVDVVALDAELRRLQQLPGRPGYFTDTFGQTARFLHPDNAARVDAIRSRIDDSPILLTALIEAADRVDSTTGVQMAYLKQWAPRALRPLQMRRPELVAGPGVAIRGDAHDLVATLGCFDLAYLDPPYNQHHYTSNYHVWETIAADDRPEHFGKACKRIEVRERKSIFNDRTRMPAALSHCIKAVDAATVIVSFNNEGWVSLNDLRDMCAVRGPVEVLSTPSRRYVGAQIGIHNPAGARVGEVKHLHNTEHVLICGELSRKLRRTITAWRQRIKPLLRADSTTAGED